MKTYKIQEGEVVIKTVRKEVLDARTCDICGKKAVGEVYWDYKWYESSQTEVKCIQESDNSIFVCSFDICPSCFLGKFADMMKREFGANINIE